MYTTEDFQELFDRTIERDIEDPEPRDREVSLPEDTKLPLLYNPFRSEHMPLLRFERMLQKWLEYPSSNPRAYKAIWHTAAIAYVKRMKRSFVPYVFAVLLEPLSTARGSLSLETFERMDHFVEIIRDFQFHKNPYYKKLLQYPIRLDLLDSLRHRFPHVNFWNLLAPLLVEGNVYY